MSLSKKIFPKSAAAAAFDPLANFETVLYTGNGSTKKVNGYIRKGAGGFSTTKFIELPPNDVISNSINADFAISIFINFDTIPASGDFQGLIGTPNSTQVSNTYLLVRGQGSNEVAFDLQRGFNGTLYYGGPTGYNPTKVAVSTNTWYHLLVNYTASTKTVDLYLNNTSLGSYNLTLSGSYALTTNFALGNYAGSHPSGTYYFRGRVDQLRIFNTPITNSADRQELIDETYDSPTKSTTDIFGDGSAVALYELDGDASDTGGGSGKIGGGAIFNGSSSYIDVSYPYANSTFSISLWFKANSIATAGAGVTTIISGRLNGTNTNVGNIWIDSQKMRIHSTTKYADVTYSFNTNQWYHIGIIYDSSNFYGIVNGSIITPTNVTSYSGTNNTLRIGDISYNGSIDQVRLFNKTLSSGEVTTLYGETSASSTKSTTDIFSDGSGVALYELEGNANDTGGASGKFGSGAIFNAASSKITTPITTNYSNISLSCWVKFTSLPTGGADATLFFKGFYVSGTNTQYIHLRYEDSTNQFTFGVRENSTYNQVATSGVTASLNTWYHVVGTLDSSGNAQIYVNGSAGTGITSAPTMTNSNGIEVGSSNSSINGYFILDDARIYSDVLTLQEVGYIYNNTTASIPSNNLLAYYKLDGDATDEQGNYDGTATNVSFKYDGTATNVAFRYDGTATNVDFLGMAFQPDLVWVKNRDTTGHHALFDSVRGEHYIIYSNLDNEQAINTSFHLDSFDTNGFTMVGNSNATNSTDDFVAWCWKAGGNSSTFNIDGTGYATASAAGLDDGSINPTGASVNTAAGFSIIKFTASGGTNTISHGLSSTPDVVLMKRTSTTSDWYFFTTAIDGSMDYLRFDTGNKTDITTQSFTTTTFKDWASSGDWIAYCFHSVDEYQKVGSYSGGGATNVTVSLGFQPRFVMIKRATGGVGSWIMYDNIRQTGTIPYDNYTILLADSNYQEQSDSTLRGIQFTTDGFILNNNYELTNYSGDTYIYLAIA